MPGKRLTVDNGDVRDAGDCPNCLLSSLPDRHDECPYCGTDL